MYRRLGWYQRIDTGKRFQVKRIQAVAGGRRSLRQHYPRADQWVAVRGTAEVAIDERVVLVHENETVYLSIGSMYQLANPG
ncbi:Alginate biosynthesis protein AlgA [Methylobacterium mesophilicum]|nr:Alginate biosynthesis protein AlgA [Methylobacterium mesophilicum]